MLCETPAEASFGGTRSTRETQDRVEPNGGRVIFRQLFDPETSSYTYLLADDATGRALLIDPVLEQLDRDCTLLSELGLQLCFTLETHLHADHVTASGRLRERLGAKVAGDALLIRGCGHTDFQQGDPKKLFRSVQERILSLPDETCLYPGHDYKGRTVTTVVEEKRFNPRLGLDRSLAEFSQIMSELNLAHPRQIDRAVPANRVSGLDTGAAEGAESLATPPQRGAVAEAMDHLGRQDTEPFLGMGI